METESLEKMLEEQMREAAAAMDFELAAQLRDQLFEVRARRGQERGSPKIVAGGARRPLDVARADRPAARGARPARARPSRAQSTGASGSAASPAPPLVVTISR